MIHCRENVHWFCRLPLRLSVQGAPNGLQVYGQQNAPLQKIGASLRTLSNHHRLRESSEFRRGRRRQERRRLGEMESAWA